MRREAPRHHKTGRSQLVSDKLATVLFTAMGIGVIGAVLAMVAFFTATIIPLFSPIVLELERLHSLESQQDPSTFVTPPPLTFVHDADSPFMAEVYQGETGCSVVQGLSRGTGSAADQRGTWRVLAQRSIVWPETAPAPVLGSDQQGSGQGDGAADGFPVRCYGLEDSRFAVVRFRAPDTGRTDGGRSSPPSRIDVAVLELGTRRDFLPQADLAGLGPERLKELEGQRWIVEEQGRFLAMASREAPVAALEAEVQSLMVYTTPLPSIAAQTDDLVVHLRAPSLWTVSPQEPGGRP